MLLSDHAWLWARGYQGGGPHAALLRRLLHWLMQEPELEEEALTAHAQGRNLVVERQTLSDRPPDVSVTGPGGGAQPVPMTEAQPGLWRGTVEDAPLGLHRAEAGALTALAHIGPANPAEFQDVISTTDRLAPIAEATGGSVQRVSQRQRRFRAENHGRVAARTRHPAATGSACAAPEATTLKSIDQSAAAWRPARPRAPGRRLCRSLVSRSALAVMQLRTLNQARSGQRRVFRQQ
jgi:hypothetical protein